MDLASCYLTIIECNHAIMRSEAEQTLLEAICRLLVERGGYQMAWVGYAMEDAGKTITLAAKYGDDGGYLDEGRLSWADAGAGWEPSGAAIRAMKPVVVRDIAGDRHGGPWREEALSRGYGAVMAIPLAINPSNGELLGDSHAHGVLSIVADTANAFSETEAELLIGLAGDLAAGIQTLRDRAQRQQKEEENRQRVSQLAKLLETSQSLNANLDLNIVLQTISDGSTAVLGMDTAAIYLLSGDQLRLGATTPPLPPDFPEVFRYTALGEHPHLGQAIATRTPVVLPDSQIAELTASERVICETRNLRTMLYVPLTVADQTNGVLIIGTIGTTRVINDAEINICLTFSNQAAVAIQNALLVDETHSRLVELDALNRVSSALRIAQSLDQISPLLLEETLAALNTRHGSIMLFDPSTRQLQQVSSSGWFDQIGDTHLMPGEGIAGKVFESGEPYLAAEFVSDETARIATRSQIPAGWGGCCVPIRTSDGIIGVLFASVQLPRQLSKAETDLLSTLAEMAGMAIHRTRLFEQTELRLRLMQAIYRIDTTISASRDLRITLDVLLDQIINQMKVNAAALLLLDPVSGKLEYAAGNGFHTRGIEKTVVRPGEGLAGRAMMERRIVTSNNLLQTAGAFTRAEMLVDENFVVYYGIPLLAKGRVKGVLEIFHRSPLNLDKDWLDFLEALATQAAIAIDDAAMFENLQRSNFELARAYDTTLEGWSRALDLRDRETEGHTQRVTETTVRLAVALGLGENDLVNIRRGAMLHDIGKMGIPDSILFKPGPLDEAEWGIMRQHPQLAYDLLSPITYLNGALDIPFGHHERWDGSGYPRGLQGAHIPLAARIFAVVDCWDALRSDRSYRPGWSDEQARAYIVEASGKQFDPRVVDVFLNLIR